MDSLIITPKNKQQAEKIKSVLLDLNIDVRILTKEDKEDAGLLRAMIEGENEKGEIPLDEFLRSLRGS